MFSRYEMTNCLFEATLQEIEKECNCTPKYFMDTVEGFSACEGKQKKCMNQLMTEMGDKREIIDDGEEKVGLIFCLQVKFFFSFSYTLDLPCRMY